MTMKQKDQYTLYELFDNLPLTLTELSKLTGKSHGTLTRIRDGEPCRKSTINRLLMVLSEVYKIDLSTENVEGITLEGRQQQKPSLANEVAPIAEKSIDAIPQNEVAQNRTVEPKRAYVRKADSALPDGALLATEFAARHGIKRETMRDHMNIGLGPGLIHGDDIADDCPVVIKDWVRFEERNKRVRKDGAVERERFLTAEQQSAALAFWQRHRVQVTQCDQPGCPCHGDEPQQVSLFS